MLEGRQFNVSTDQEIFAVLDAAVTAGTFTYKQSGSAKDAADLFLIQAVETAVNDEANKEANGQSDPSTQQRAGTALWERVNQALEPYKGVSAVVDAVASLPPDSVSPEHSWLKPVLTVGGVLAVFGVGYWWTRQKPGHR